MRGRPPNTAGVAPLGRPHHTLADIPATRTHPHYPPGLDSPGAASRPHTRGRGGPRLSLTPHPHPLTPPTSPTHSPLPAFLSLFYLKLCTSFTSSLPQPARLQPVTELVTLHLQHLVTVVKLPLQPHFLNLLSPPIFPIPLISVSCASVTN